MVRAQSEEAIRADQTRRIVAWVRANLTGTGTHAGTVADTIAREFGGPR